MATNYTLDEKWRPKTFTDLVGNTQIVDEVRIMVRNKNIPHLLFHGMQGIGKTSLALVIVRELFGGVTKRRVLELNASEARGIDVVRNRIKTYAEMSSNIKDVPFRVIILDECDALTTDAQTALRRTMELNAKHCRFILICNYVGELIDPLRSRCQEHEFAAVKVEEMLPRLKYICEKESIDITGDALKYIAKESGGDMRKSIVSYISRIKLLNHGTITLERIKKIKPNLTKTAKLLSNSLNNHFLNARNLFYNAIKRGSTAKQILNSVNEASLEHAKMSERMKGDVSICCLESEFKIHQGCTPELVICSFIRNLGKIGDNYKK